MFRYLVALTLASVSPLIALERGWNSESLVSAYHHASEMQRHWALDVLGQNPLVGDEEVLDYGCGDGKITAMVSHFLPRGQITGVDLSPSMIRYAQRRFPVAYFPNLHFEQLSDFASDHKFDVVCSFCVFHIVPNPVEVLSKLRALTRPGGKLLLVVPGSGSDQFLEAGDQVLTYFGLQKLLPVLQAEDHSSIWEMQGVVERVEAAGWTIVSSQYSTKPHVFFDRDELVDWMVGTLSANWGVPLELAPAVYNYFLDRWIELEPEIVSENGSIVWHGARTEVVAINV
jgi:trans-aconitate methyltransferase